MRHGLASLVGVVRRSVRRHDMFAAGERVLIALSGGCDSTGLALVLYELRARLGIDLVAGHVHHGLRGADADLDQECAAETAARLAIPFHAAAVAPGVIGCANIEERARQERYAALAAMAGGAGCAKIATGHTLDDQAETFLMRLLRGAGGTGLGAIEPHRGDGVVRPLIDCRREAVAAAVRGAGLRFRNDASNEDPRFLRAQVRGRLVPLLEEINPAAVESCARAADLSRGAARLAREWLAAAAARLGVGEVLPLTALAGLDGDARRALARFWLTQRLGRRNLAAVHVEAVLRLAESRSGRTRVQLPGGRTVRRRRGQLHLEEGPAADSGAARRRAGKTARKQDAQGERDVKSGVAATHDA